MLSRYEVLETYAKDKEDDLENLKKAALSVLEKNQLNETSLKYLIKEAFWLGHYVGHIRGEQYQSNLLEEYREALREADEWREAHEW